VYLRIAQWLWIALLIYWFLGAMRSAPAKRTEGRAWTLLRALLTVSVFVLLFSSASRWGWLGARFVSRNPVVSILGLVFTAAGVGLAMWARYVLGRNWSAAVEVKHSHELICGGPYARIRHPIYSGVILGLIGTALLIGEWRGLIALAALTISWLFKAQREEALLATEFGLAFAEHRAHTGMFLPRVR
jgi:protein-S-isoprenylcysteine O-methyltransferase Ste14